MTHLRIPVLRLRASAFAMAVAAAVAVFPAGPAAAQGAAAPDSLDRFLHSLADSTDRSFGMQSVTIDTSGLDSLATWALDAPGSADAGRRRLRQSVFPLLRWHRAEGAVAGLGTVGGGARTGVFDVRGSYGFSNREGRYAFAWRRTLWHAGPRLSRLRALRPGRIGEGSRLDLGLRYARETAPFMPEHASPGLDSPAAFFFGTSEQSAYETRGYQGDLTLWTGDFRLLAGFHHGTDQPMPLATRFSVFGARDRVVANELALRDRYDEAVGGIGYRRFDWELEARLDARGGGRDRWRLVGAIGKAVRLGPAVKAFAQVEGGATAAAAPPQRRFQVGGDRLLPTLPYGTGSGDHLLAGKLELVGSQDVLAALRLPRPDWLILNPSVFVHGAAVWDDPAGRDVAFSRPPAGAWRGAAGFGLVYRVGIPEPDTFWRLGVAWPVGAQAGDVAIEFSIDRTFDLIGRL